MEFRASQAVDYTDPGAQLVYLCGQAEGRGQLIHSHGLRRNPLTHFNGRQKTLRNPLEVEVSKKDCVLSFKVSVPLPPKGPTHLS